MSEASRLPSKMRPEEGLGVKEDTMSLTRAASEEERGHRPVGARRW